MIRKGVSRCLIPALLALAALPSHAKIDLVTLPDRDRAQLTIYNSADLTLVRDSRSLTLKEGLNRLEFSWANTLIDPTSLDMLPKANAGQIEIFDLEYPPRARNLGIWSIRSKVRGQVPMEITYLTSGLSWRAFYMGTLSADEKTMRLQGYVRVMNQSGEDYENAQVRLIVGQVHMIDQIAALASRQPPYGRPGAVPPPAPMVAGSAPESSRKLRAAMEMAAAPSVAMKPKEIVKEGLSEYFIYTIEGTETIPHGWSKRLPSMSADAVPVVNLYKYEEERWGPSVIRMLSFKNDKPHKLGDTPIPGGMLKVYRQVDPEQHLSYEGQSSFKYIPVEEDVELNLGAVGNVVVTPTLMDQRSDQFLFDKNGNIEGWVEIRDWKLEVKNTRDVACRIEITRNFDTPHWGLEKTGDAGAYEKVDLDTARFTLELPPRTNREFRYTLTTRHGRRTE